MERDQLKAISAIVRAGTFEAAARELDVTPSAVSQRIKALESAVGKVLLRRGSPCTATEAGEVVLRHARRLESLEDETRQLLGEGAAGPTVTSIAVNADSLGDWFTGVLRAVAAGRDTLMRIHVEDEGHSGALLRAGTVIGAVTSDPVPVAGCTVVPLGAQRYQAVAAPSLLAAFRTPAGPDWEHLPIVRFDLRDDLQHRLLRGISRRSSAPEWDPPQHHVPAADGHREAVIAGLGWGLLTEARAVDAVTTGSLVRLTEQTLEVPLYWQVWNLHTERIEILTRQILTVARSTLTPPPGEEHRPGTAAHWSDNRQQNRR